MTTGRLKKVAKLMVDRIKELQEKQRKAVDDSGRSLREAQGRFAKVEAMLFSSLVQTEIAIAEMTFDENDEDPEDGFDINDY